MHFPIVALIGRYQDTGLDAPLRALAAMLTQAGRRVLVDADTARNTAVHEYPVATMQEIGESASLAVVMGGDGTVLGVARHLAPYGVPLIGINHGRLGFITDIPLQDAHDALARVLDGNFQIEERMLLQGSVWRGDALMYTASALNDVVLNRAGRGGMIEMRVELDGVYMYTQRADGLIIATPTGSTAYALSANGPLLHPGLNAMVLVPVAPQSLSNRPIVIPDTGVLNMTLTAIGRVETGASAHFDMQTWSDLQLGDRITVQRAPHTARLVHPQGYSFFSTLRRKLHWNQMPQVSDNIE
ncbi:NAD kinase [Bordetella avium]|uniref:NAD kinase n=1 Tax=Bordetella avium (strain 197N) TaxID=360910 RepID=NADK_BORA1|nr:NAD kinase [Bordetella avium]Q2KW92.1 RecName: Full=NAD kinase; AltName: Full=ATP-dependent NAD kinase [Bordetella avium 197N]AZY50054.1 NAD kinase [Bordetella avium]AZY53419.1 NAD kinase [Bordetella avium]RIQ12988.1 NAD kinase [Bordetella avium]RIQ17411.1 NAD kinase [Bordetella avium]RIQ33898.1 NAD kinase [Bordetella avium]